MKIPKIVTAFILFALYGFIVLLFPITLALGNQEITNTDVSFNLFLFSMIFFIGAGITFLGFIAFKILTKNNKLGDNLGFVNLGEKPALSIFKRFTYPQIIWLSTIFFGLIFFVANILKAGSFTGMKLLPMQFSKVDSLLFSSFLVAGSEEMLSMAVITISILILTLLALKYEIKSKEYAVYVLLLVPIVVGLFAILWHSTAYKGSDVALTVVFLFWTLKTFIVLTVGLFLVGFIIHFYNNFFIDTARLFLANSIILFINGFVLAIIIIGYLWVYRGKWFGSKQVVQNEKN